MRGVLSDGEILRSDRVRCGMTQEELADRAGLDVKTVRKAERGGRLDLSTMGLLAVALGTVATRLVRPRPLEGGYRDRRRAEVRRWLRAWDAHDREAVLAIYHDEATLRLPGGPDIPFHGTFRGRDEIGRAHETAWDSCRTEPCRWESMAVHVADDAVILEGPRGVHMPNGEIVSLRYVQFFTFEGDRVIDHRVDCDTLEFIRILGLPAPNVVIVGEEDGSSR